MCLGLKHLGLGLEVFGLGIQVLDSNYYHYYNRFMTLCLGLPR